MFHYLDLFDRDSEAWVDKMGEFGGDSCLHHHQQKHQKKKDQCLYLQWSSEVMILLWC